MNYKNEITGLKNRENFKISAKAILLAGLFLLFLSSLVLAVPNTLTLQGKLTDETGQLQTGVFNFSFKIYDSSTGGAELFSLNDRNISVDSSGVYDIILGDVNLPFSSEYYLGITVSDDNESLPRINLTSSPYAFRANTSESLNPNSSYIVSNLTVLGNATIGVGDSNLEIKSLGFNLTTIGNMFLSLNLSVDGNTLFVDSENNKVGIGTNAPDTKLKVVGDLNVTGTVYGLGSNISAGEGGWNDDGSNVVLTTSSDNVGVGVSSPTEKLQVSGNTSITGDVVVGGYLIAGSSEGSGTLASIGWADDGSVVRLAASTDKVGIGTASPSTKLYIDNGNISLTAGQFLQVDASGLRELIGTDSTGHGQTIIRSVDSDTGDGIEFQSNADAALMTILNTGNVGIGTTNPANKLEVVGTINTTGDIILQDGQSIKYVNGSNSGILIRHVNGLLQIGDINNVADFEHITFETNAAERMRITSAGNVGIGTTAPAGKLSVVSSSGNHIFINRSGGSHTAAFIGIGSEDILYITDWSTGTKGIMINTTSGNVGIGTTAPDFELHVFGTGGGRGEILSDGTAGGNLILGTSGTPEWQIYNTGTDLRFWDSTDRVTFKNGGNVGIGVIDPNATLDVANTGIRSLDSPSPSPGNGKGLELHYTDSYSNGEGGYIMPFDRTSTTYKALNFDAFNHSFFTSGGSADLTILAGGNVGIGTTSPIAPLEVQVASASNFNLLFNYSATDGGTIGGPDIVAKSDHLTNGWGRIRFALDDGTDTSEDSSIRFETADAGTVAERMRIDLDGNVGIGTTAPAGKLSVVSSSGNHIFINRSGGSHTAAFIGIGSEDILYITDWSTGTKGIMINTTSGNVGIGTTSPDSELDIESADPQIKFTETGVGTWGIQVNSDDLHIDDVSAGATRLAIDNTGNVGIGTTSPAGRLEVIGAAGDGFPTINATGTSGEWTALFIGDNGASSLGLKVQAGDKSSTSASFQVNSYDDTETFFEIENNGNVGIGTTSPDDKLHVMDGSAGSVTANSDAQLVVEDSGHAFIQMLSGSTSQGGILFGDEESSVQSQIYYDHNANKLHITTDNSATQALTIDSSRRVGIGTTAPTETLVVAGNANITGTLYQGTSAYSNPDIAETMKPLGGVNFESGSVVCVSEKDPEGFDNYVEICKGKYNSSVVGIVSVNATMIIGSKGEMPVALMGRVFVKVTNESGPISKGDLLTTSSTPGYAMKFTLLNPEDASDFSELKSILRKNEQRRNSILGKALGSFKEEQTNQKPADNEGLVSGTYSAGKIMALATMQ